MRKIILITLLCALVVFACEDGKDTETHVHDWGKWVVTTDPTTTTEGEETRTCTTCGATETKTVAKLIQRVFTDIKLTGYESHPITITDARTGANDTDLETMGVISRLTAGLLGAKNNVRFDTVIGRGIEIIVEDSLPSDDPNYYARLKAYSQRKIGVNIGYITTDDENIGARMSSIISTMYAHTIP